MRQRWITALACGLLTATAARAQVQFGVLGDIDVRWVHASSDTSFLYGGPGQLRFDSTHEDLRLGRAFLEPSLRFADTLTLKAVVDAYADDNWNSVNLSEFYLSWRPFPTNSIRWSAKVGAFFMPVSLENRGHGWSDVYTITPSALNTWIGEEFRTIGTEVEARWLGASQGYAGDVALVAAVYAWNDPAGVLLAERGFVMADRPSGLFGTLQNPRIGFYHEVDRRPGYYAGIDWHHGDWFELRALHYDNLANLDTYTEAGGSAWRTAFDSIGARLEPDAHWTFIVQALTGNTQVRDAPQDPRFSMNLRASFALASFEWRGERLTARYDDFNTHQLSGFYGPPDNDAGHAWTLAWSHRFTNSWEFAAEWIRLIGGNPARTELSLPAPFNESQLQLALRYRFEFKDRALR